VSGALATGAGVHLEIGETVASRKELERALELAQSIGDRRGAFLALLGLGDLARRLHDSDQTIAYWTRAEEAVRALDAKSDEAELLLELGRLAIAAGRFEEAKKRFDASLAIARAQGMRALEAAALGGQAERLRAQGDAEAALGFYEQGRKIARDLASPELAWPLEHGRGKALEALGRRDQAVAAYRAAIEAIEQVRGRLRDEALRSGYMEERCQVYADLARLLLDMGKVGEAFGYVERHRARAYLDLVGGEKGGPVPALAPEGGGRGEERELRRKIERLSQLLEQERVEQPSERREAAVTSFSRELAEAQRRYTLLLSELRAADPEYASLVSVSPLDVGRVQGLLDADSALVEYFLAGDAVHVFVLTATRLAHVSLPETAEAVGVRVALLRDRLAAGSDDWRGPAESLWDLLIAPAEATGLLAGTKRLYLVPQGVLHHLPFAALVAPADAGGSYLVQRYELAQLPSASTLSLCRQRPAHGRTSALAFAPDRARLQLASQEAQAMAESFGQGGRALAGSAASEHYCKSHCGEYAVLHFASHSEFDRKNPLFSHVVLEPGDGDDGNLNVFEIMPLKLAADLVTLSACNTGLGSGYFRETPAGDDLVSLTSAFLRAGAASVVASLWDVGDGDASELMRRFYGHLRDSDKAGALARAQREMLASGGAYATPRAWASFILVGDAR